MRHAHAAREAWHPDIGLRVDDGFTKFAGLPHVGFGRGASEPQSAPLRREHAHAAREAWHPDLTSHAAIPF